MGTRKRTRHGTLRSPRTARWRRDADYRDPRDCDRRVLAIVASADFSPCRARRLVVDTGLHAKGWTRQQAIDYGIEASEIDRYVVNPGQACAYMIGQLKFVELREKMRAALGARFDPKVYHDLVLSTGTVPLTMIEDVVDRYIAANR